MEVDLDESIGGAEVHPERGERFGTVARHLQNQDHVRQAIAGQKASSITKSRRSWLRTTECHTRSISASVATFRGSRKKSEPVVNRKQQRKLVIHWSGELGRLEKNTIGRNC